MNPPSAAHTVIATPELALIVFAHLTPHDLAQCIRVCKAWSQQLEPILWANYCSPDYQASSTGLIRNLPFIRTAELKTESWPLFDLTHGLPLGSESAVLPNTLCTNLRRFRLRERHHDSGSDLDEPDAVAKYARYLVLLLKHNHFLTHLTFPLVLFDDDRLSPAISRMRHLQHLAVTTSGSVPGNRSTLLLLQTCLPLPNLTELVMDFELWWRDDDKGSGPNKLKKDGVCLDLETIIKESAIARFSQNPSASKIKLLQFPVCLDDVMHPLVVPLLTSGLLDLESCTIPWVTQCQNTREIERDVLEYCPNLKSLTYGRSEQQYPVEDDEFPRAFIRGCLRLETFVTKGYSCLDSDSDEPIISDLVAHHCNTLREIELKHCSQLSGRCQQAILSRCKQLRRFWVEGYSQSYIGLNFTDVARSDWVCMELKELRLTLDLHFDVGGDVSELEEDEILNTHSLGQASFTDTESVERARKRFFTQIGRLSKLEKLTLDIGRDKDIQKKHWWELTLSQGELGELAGLKNLRSLRLEADFWTKMGQAEVEFMHERWPLLEEIILCGKASDIDSREDLLMLRTLSHWQWLFDKRPQLLFTTHVPPPLEIEVYSPSPEPEYRHRPYSTASWYFEKQWE